MPFTPGEWEAIAPKNVGKHWKVITNGLFGGNQGAISGAKVMWNLASIDNGAPGDTLETEGENARLFAASKKLLEALRMALSQMDDARTNLIELAGEDSEESKAFDEPIRVARAAISKAVGP
jgi:hypothetical protein